MRECASPEILSRRVIQRSAVWSVDDLFRDPLSGLMPQIPERLRGATLKRKAELLAGRYCAAAALREAGCDAGVAMPEGGHERAPRWPAGFVGSITHTEEFASAAIARAAACRGIGIDSELIIEPRRAERLRHGIMNEAEGKVLHPAGEMPPSVLVTLVFSMKESVFKCLHPLTGVFMWFGDVRVKAIDQKTGTFVCAVERDLGPHFPRGGQIEGRWAWSGAHVHTAVELR